MTRDCDNDHAATTSKPIVLRQGDTLPQVTVIVRDSTGALVDLTQPGTTATFKLVSATGVVVLLSGAATISNAAASQVTYTFLSTDTLMAMPGAYQGTFRITYPGGATQTVPTSPLEAPYIPIVLLAA